ncbi:MAG TPA: DUF362 domain-containing protein [Pelovirga sp.]|nr:DUF362 domain-containing protein [Pelovirga sp.]
MNVPCLPPSNRVSLTALGNYDPDATEAAVRTLLAPLGGMEAFVRPGQKVLIKPNMLTGKSPERAVTTHPQVVRAVIRLVMAAGGQVSVGDSPGIGSPAVVARKTGILEVIEETGAHFAPFAESVIVHPQGTTLHQIEVAKDILDADVIINLPKLKTHQMMGLTCAVKNMFGALIGMRKPGMHLQAGVDKNLFARMLLEICEALPPRLNIVDAVIGMEGEGPGSGDPVKIGALLAGTSAQAVDTVATALVKMQPEQVFTQQQALVGGRPLTRLAELELVGSPLAELQVDHFHAAKMTDVNFGIPGYFGRRLKHLLTAHPQVDHQRCVRCHACVKHCPPQAMAIVNDRLSINYDLCIRCFCCQELCPHAALTTHQGLLLRLSSRMRRTNRVKKDVI